MEFLLSNQWSVVIFATLTVIGLGICWFGVLVSLVTALGNKMWWWSAGILLLGPIVGIPFAVVYKEADYARSLMIKGGILAMPGLVFGLYIWLFT